LKIKTTLLCKGVELGIGLASITTLILAGCGGGSGSSSSNGGVTSYNFVAPVVGSQRIYTQTIIDNSSNVINLSFKDTTTIVNPDGSFSFQEVDPISSVITVNNTAYSIQAGTYADNNSGQIISFTPLGVGATTCTLTPHGTGPTYPITIGKTWTTTYTSSCGGAATTSQSGSVVGVESVTVPAGTFQTTKLQSTITWADINGIYTDTGTNWRDVNTGIFVKRTVNHNYSYIVPPVNGYPLTTSIVFASGVL